MPVPGGTSGQKRTFKTGRKTAELGLMSALLAACGGTSDPEEAADSPVASPTNLIAAPSPQKSASLHISSADPFQSVAAGTDHLALVFAENGSVDLSGMGDIAVIDLGLDADGHAHANTGRADIDGLKASHVTLNIHADSHAIEVDHAPHTAATLSVGLTHKDVALVVDDQGADPLASLELHHFQTVHIDHYGDHPAIFTGSIDLNGHTETLTLTTSLEGGDLILNAPPVAASPSTLWSVPVLLEGEHLKHLSVQAVDGDILLAPNGRYFLNDASALQTYHVTAHDADVTIGTIGLLPMPFVPGPPFGPLPTYPIPGHVLELETIEVSLEAGATFSSNQLLALGSQIASMVLTANDNNTVAGGYNLLFSKTYAHSVGYQELNALDGGNILLQAHSYTVHTQVFTGSGNIEISAPAGNSFYTYRGYIQTEPADASDHTGTRSWTEAGNGALDVFYGSNKDDLIIFGGAANPFTLNPEGIYHDSGGADKVEVRGSTDILINDGDAGTNDVIEIGVAGPLSASRVTFNVGSGEDQVIFGAPASFYSAFNDRNLIDFGTYLDGRVDIDGLGTVPGRALSFDGLDGITANSVAPVITPGSAVSQIDDNRIYIVADGDVPVQGSAIQDYENLSDVADFLGVITSHSAPANAHAIFIVHNKATSSTPGDDRDVYFYHFAGDAQATAITAQDLTLLGTATLQPFPGASLPLEIQANQIV